VVTVEDIASHVLLEESKGLLTGQMAFSNTRAQYQETKSANTLRCTADCLGVELEENFAVWHQLTSERAAPPGQPSGRPGTGTTARYRPEGLATARLEANVKYNHGIRALLYILTSTT
jgi:hypothetical protein